MMKNLLSTGMMLVFLLLSAPVGFAQQPALSPPSIPSASADAGNENLQLVWADEFNQDGPPDPANWAFENGFVRNEELQWYQPGNARCENGMLIIEARRERVANPSYDASRHDWKRNRPLAEYTSASLHTEKLHSWLYGRFVMRGRIDTRAGLWPAYWTVGTEHGWPSGGEIDIMEYYRGMLLANACWASGKPWVPIWDSVKKPITEFHDPEWSQKFHIWRMDWDKQRIDLFVDDELMNSVDLHETINQDHEKKNPFHEPQFLIVNLAIGGFNGGDPSQTDFPARFELDYVRVYQEKP